MEQWAYFKEPISHIKVVIVTQVQVFLHSSISFLLIMDEKSKLCSLSLCSQYIFCLGSSLYLFTRRIAMNAFNFSICQKQFEYHYVVKYSFQGKEMFLPNCLTVFDDHYHFSNEKTRRNVNEMKKVEQRKGKTTI